MWSNTIAWWYLSNIFGIGRDDNQELSQLKSKSINNDAIVMIEADWEGSNILILMYLVSMHEQVII